MVGAMVQWLLLVVVCGVLRCAVVGVVSWLVRVAATAVGATAKTCLVRATGGSGPYRRTPVATHSPESLTSVVIGVIVVVVANINRLSNVVVLVGTIV